MCKYDWELGKIVLEFYLTIVRNTVKGNEDEV